MQIPIRSACLRSNRVESDEREDSGSSIGAGCPSRFAGGQRKAQLVRCSPRHSAHRASGHGVRNQCLVFQSSAFRCCKSKCRLSAGAQGQIQQAAQPPASLVAVASVCLQAASPNAQCVQAMCRRARGLTLQSRGQTTAGQALLLLPKHSRRCLPLISNVGRRQPEPASGRFRSCGKLRKLPGSGPRRCP